MSLFFGKYRGTVESNGDTTGQGLIEVTCPDVLGDAKVWATPSSQYAGSSVGILAVPPKGAKVWVEFERGETELPIWSGGFWLLGQTTAMGVTSADIKMIKTGAITMTLNDTSSSGGFTLDVGSPAVSTAMKIVCDANGMVLSFGTAAKITLDSNGILLAVGSSGSPKIALTTSSITIEAGASGKIEATSSKVAINGNALEVS
jgi:hypothetical protein